jgi:hypothetical protein
MIMKIKLNRDSNTYKLEEDLKALRLQPTKDYKLIFDYHENEILIEFMNPMKASLWRVAVGYKYI